MESMENTRHRGLSCRLALMISCIVSQFLFDVPVSSFEPRIVSACPIVQEDRLL